jgi:hypothetical protein
MNDLLVLAASILTMSFSPSPLKGKPEPVPEGGHKLEAVYGGHGRDLWERPVDGSVTRSVYLVCGSLLED